MGDTLLTDATNSDVFVKVSHHTAQVDVSGDVNLSESRIRLVVMQNRGKQ